MNLIKVLTSSSLSALLVAAGIAGAAPPGAPFGSNNINISRDVGVISQDDANPSIAYNPSNNQYLVVWWGDDATVGDNAFEVFGRVFHATGIPAGSRFQISDTGPDATAIYQARLPDVTYNPDTGEYLVVWFADDVAPEDVEVHGQRVSALGALVGANFQISDTNATNPVGNALNPAVAHAGAGGFLVVWQADGTAVDNEVEIFGRLVGADGSTPNPEFRISTQGADGVIEIDATQPDVAYRSGVNQFLVVWKGDVSATGTPDNFEIFAQLVDPSGSLIGGRIPMSFTNAALAAEHPAVAYNASADEFMVTWRESVNSQILGRIIGAGGALKPAGANLAVSAVAEAPAVDEAGDNGPSLAFNPLNDQYMVNWPGSVKGRAIPADGSLSTLVEDFSQQIGELSVDVAYNSTFNEYFTVFDADGIVGGAGNKIVYGQRRTGSAR